MKTVAIPALLAAILLAQIVGLLRGGGVTTSRWEYQTKSVSEFPVEGSELDSGPLTQYLNMMTELSQAGAEGWELVTVTRVNGLELVFKRRR